MLWSRPIPFRSSPREPNRPCRIPLEPLSDHAGGNESFIPLVHWLGGRVHSRQIPDMIEVSFIGRARS